MRHQSYEATLLARHRLDLDDTETGDDLRALIAKHGLELAKAETVDGMFLVLDCGPVQVLVAFSNDPMPVMHFVNAGRPAGATRDETEILARLHAHKATATVLVTDTAGATLPRDPRRDVLKHDLCWDLTDWLFTRIGPDLVFWCDSDTLYSEEEFDQITAAAAFDTAYDAAFGIAPLPVPDPDPVRAAFRAEPPIWDTAHAWVADPPTPAPEHTPDHRRTPGEAMVESMLTLALPTWAAIRLATLQDSWEPRSVVRQATRACTVCTLSLLGISAYGGPLGL